MKYNDEAFNICSQHYHDIQDIETSKIDRLLQNELLKILLKRFLEELDKSPNQNNGIIKVRIKSAFWQSPEEGYYLIKKLVEESKFDTFASQYCMYLGKVENRCDEYCSAYFEIIWDYKTYFEFLNMGRIDIDEAKSEYKETLNSESSSICDKEGYEFSRWKKQTITSYETAFIDHQLIPHYKNISVIWARTCSRCGYVEKVCQEPQELIDERKEKNRQKEIKRLERRLEKLKEKN